MLCNECKELPKCECCGKRIHNHIQPSLIKLCVYHGVYVSRYENDCPHCNPPSVSVDDLDFELAA